MWDFGDGASSTERQPQHRYSKEGNFSISLIAFNDFQCADTARVTIDVIKGGHVLIPNAFSPNPTGSTGTNPDSGKNDVFLPLMKGVVEFELLIFNRWGELLFQTRDEQFGWDGYYNGKLCPQDVYVYKLTASLDNGEKIVRVGDINLIR
jgi:gliding motility-associated-like protein